MREKTLLISITISLYLCQFGANAKTLIISNDIMKTCAIYNRTTSFKECLWSKGKFGSDPTPPEPNTPPTPDTPPTEPPEEPDNPTPPEPEEPPVTPPNPSNPSMPAAGASATGTANANNGPADGNEVLESDVCIQQKGTWSTTANTCVGTDGTGWESVWNHDTMKFDCMNAIEYADYRKRLNQISQQNHRQIYELWYNTIYASENVPNPNYTDLQWTLTGRNAPKCMSKIERQCNESGGFFDYGDNKTGKCYNHNKDKEYCEKIGAKYKDEGGYYTCNCKIAGQDKRILWIYDPRGNAPEYTCQYHKGNNNWNTYYGVDSQFFESCLRNHIDPAFNIIIQGTSFFIIKKLNCE